MAGQRLTDKTLLLGNTTKDDLYMIVDESDTTGSTAGTSKKMKAEQLIQTTIKSISASAFTSMDATGNAGTFVELLPAAGTGLFYVILNVTINTNVTTQDTSATTLYIGYNATSLTGYVIQQRRFGHNQSSSSYSLAPLPFTNSGDDLGTLTTKDLLMYSSQNFTGDFTADAYITYRLCSIV
tara:strand:+ start:382 stop:927 length:546 start_codon:yes stop_codon:yes gene_type:complete